MQQEQKAFLSLGMLPARVTAEQAAWLLGFQESEIAVLVGTKLLKPLGRPPANGAKYFSSFLVDELRRDRAWLDKASDAIIAFWRNRNARRKTATIHPLPKSVNSHENERARV